jgi:RHS repeat-associated protein
MVTVAETIPNRIPRGAARGRGMDILSMNQNHPRSAPYRSNFYRLNPNFSRDDAHARNYDPSLGRWINQYPAGYINGVNTYQFVMSNPVGNVDPEGLFKDDIKFINYLQKNTDFPMRPAPFFTNISRGKICAKRKLSKRPKM